MTDTIQTEQGADLDPRTAHHVAVIESQRADLERVRGLLEERSSALISTRNELNDARDAHRSDIATIGSVLIGEATDRDWCADYDGIVDRLNRTLSVELPTRESDYVVTYNVTVSFSVTARNEEDALYQASAMRGYAERSLDESDGVNHSSSWDRDGIETAD